jgi:hypothetical protein
MLNGLHEIYLPHILNILRSSYIFSSRGTALHRLLEQALDQLKRPLGFSVEDCLATEKHMMEYEDVDIDLDEGSCKILLNLTGTLLVDQTMKERRMHN